MNDHQSSVTRNIEEVLMGLWPWLRPRLLGLALLPLESDSSPAFLVEEYGCGLRNERGNGEVDFALCKTISILSILKILSAKITGRSTRLPQYANIGRARRLQPVDPYLGGDLFARYILHLTVRTNAS